MHLLTNLFAAARPSLQIIVLSRARSRSEFVAKMGVVLEEADETQLSLELIIESKLLPVKRVEPLLREATELVAIFVASRKSASSNLRSTS